jgi:esterase/lipase superfamily enzyme
MSQQKESWRSDRLGREVTVTRYGDVGTPVLLFPTAAGDAEEAERFLMMDALEPLFAAQRIKVYSVDSVPGMVWLKEDSSTRTGGLILARYLDYLRHELVPAIRHDCRDEKIEIIATGSSIGAFNALAAICRYPEVFSKAICMSGTYDLSKFLEGPVTDEYYHSSPLHYLRALPDGDRLARLRERFVLVTHGTGKWEEPAQSWRLAQVLGGKGIPNRVDPWGKDYDHNWPTWREMLPKYLEQITA